MGEITGVVHKVAILGSGPAGLSAAARAAARQAISAPIVAELFTLWQQTLPRISGKSKLAEAIRYAREPKALLALRERLLQRPHPQQKRPLLQMQRRLRQQVRALSQQLR